MITKVQMSIILKIGSTPANTTAVTSMASGTTEAITTASQMPIGTAGAGEAGTVGIDGIIGTTAGTVLVSPSRLDWAMPGAGTILGPGTTNAGAAAGAGTLGMTPGLGTA
jgi:hypothetical protein